MARHALDEFPLGDSPMLLRQWPAGIVEVQERRIQMIREARELFDVRNSGEQEQTRVVRRAAAAAGIVDRAVRKNCQMVEKKAQKELQERRALREIALPLEPDELSQTQLQPTTQLPLEQHVKLLLGVSMSVEATRSQHSLTPSSSQLQAASRLSLMSRTPLVPSDARKVASELPGCAFTTPRTLSQKLAPPECNIIHCEPPDSSALSVSMPAHATWVRDISVLDSCIKSWC